MSPTSHSSSLQILQSTFVVTFSFLVSLASEDELMPALIRHFKFISIICIKIDVRRFFSFQIGNRWIPSSWYSRYPQFPWECLQCFSEAPPRCTKLSPNCYIPFCIIVTANGDSPSSENRLIYIISYKCPFVKCSIRIEDIFARRKIYFVWKLLIFKKMLSNPGCKRHLGNKKSWHTNAYRLVSMVEFSFSVFGFTFM